MSLLDTPPRPPGTRPPGTRLPGTAVPGTVGSFFRPAVKFAQKRGLYTDTESGRGLSPFELLIFIAALAILTVIWWA